MRRWRLSVRVKPAKAARIEFFCGGAGMGKTTALLCRIAGAPRVLAWDMKGEFSRDHGFERVAGVDLYERLRAGAGRIAVTSHDPKHFEHFCTLAFWWGNCAVVAEELADVTRPGKAPLEWGKVLRRGRDRSLSVFAVSQRPTECDTTIFGLRTYTAAFYLPRANDRAYMARELDADRRRLDALKPYQFLERNGNAGARLVKLLG